MDRMSTRLCTMQFGNKPKRSVMVSLMFETCGVWPSIRIRELFIGYIKPCVDGTLCI